MPLTARELPEGLLDAFRLAAFQAIEHVHAYGGPVDINVKVFKRDAASPIEAKIVTIQREWRV